MNFEKVSFTAFYHDMKKHFWKITEDEIQKAFDSVQKPERKTKNSAGYDFHSPVEMVLTPGQCVSIPSGIKCCFRDDEGTGWHLKLYDRSSMGIKHLVCLPNSVGVIDADYYNNEDNEGDILLALYNAGSHNLVIHRGDRICQGVFEIYGVTSDDHATGKRTGGVGSTGKG